MANHGGVALRSRAGRGILGATVLASGLAFLDSTVVNVALPTLGRELGASTAGLQWVVDAYLLSLSAFVLLGGSLGDVLGRKRSFLAGVIAFAVTSGLCGVASSIGVLCFSRALQGAAAALLVPNSLALVKDSMRAQDQDSAVGAWAGFSGITSAAGPLLGGWLIETLSWRAVFFLNLPLAAAAVAIGHRCLPRDREARAGGVDVAGAVLAAVSLGAMAYALIDGLAHGWGWGSGACGAIALAALAAFLVRERRARAPMLPLGLFEGRQFTAANLVTLALYFALSGAMFLIVLALQHGLGYSAFGSSLVLLPVAAILLVLSPLAGRLARRIGYRWPMAAGSICSGVGLVLTARAGLSADGFAALLAGMCVLGVGLGLAVAPLTAAVLNGVDDAKTGVGAAVNNAVARLAGLLGVAILPGIGGVSIAVTGDPFLESVRRSLLAAAAACAAGAAVSWFGVPRRPRAAA
ncbi:MAG TPA: DHA2 family efflux MFS transporter permease subunit [Myxococcales bacterium]|nr:DHA2 family efflux MFS transporter permease subunit [Myxococcales bacterium]